MLLLSFGAVLVYLRKQEPSLVCNLRNGFRAGQCSLFTSIEHAPGLIHAIFLQMLP